MPTRHKDRVVTFVVIRDELIRTVSFGDGKRYQHRCSRESFEVVLDQLEGAGIGTMPSVVNATGLPYTQVDVALGFLQERGCVTVEGRKSVVRSKCLTEDALTEWHVLATGQLP